MKELMQSCLQMSMKLEAKNFNDLAIPSTHTYISSSSYLTIRVIFQTAEIVFPEDVSKNEIYAKEMKSSQRSDD